MGGDSHQKEQGHKGKSRSITRSRLQDDIDDDFTMDNQTFLNLSTPQPWTDLITEDEEKDMEGNQGIGGDLGGEVASPDIENLEENPHSSQSMPNTRLKLVDGTPGLARGTTYFNYFAASPKNMIDLMCEEEDFANLEARISIIFAVVNDNSKRLDSIERAQSDVVAKLESIETDQAAIKGDTKYTRDIIESLNKTVVNTMSSMNIYAARSDTLKLRIDNHEKFLSGVDRSIGEVSQAVLCLQDMMYDGTPDEKQPEVTTPSEQETKPPLQTPAMKSSIPQVHTMKSVDIERRIKEFRKQGLVYNNIVRSVQTFLLMYPKIKDISSCITLFFMGVVAQDLTVINCMIEELSIKDPQPLMDEVMAVDWGNKEILGNILSPIFSKLYRYSQGLPPIDDTYSVEVTQEEEDPTGDPPQRPSTKDSRSQEDQKIAPQVDNVGSHLRHNRRGIPTLSAGRGRGGYQGPISRHGKGDSLDAMLDDVLNSNRR